MPAKKNARPGEGTGVGCLLACDIDAHIIATARVQRLRRLGIAAPRASLLASLAWEA